MKILFIVPYVPNLVRTRPYNLIRYLVARGHQVTLFTVWSNEAERADLEPLKKICHEVQAIHIPTWQSLVNSLTAVPSRDPFQSVFSWDDSLVRHLKEAAPYDVVHVEHLRGSRYGLYIKENTRLPVVWDSVDCISHLFEQAVAKSDSGLGRWRSRFDLSRTRHYEGWLLDKFDHTLVTSPIDREGLLALKPVGMSAAPVTVLQNGVDTVAFCPDPLQARHPETVVISGKMSYHANISMVKHLFDNIMPLVWAQRPTVTVQIVGKDPTSEIQAMAEHPCVTVTGTVQEVVPYLQRATVAVSPITYGAGIQNKVLEAMACGTAVVTTSKAVAAIQVQPGRDLLIADEPEAFAKAILSLLENESLRQQIGAAARSYVETNHHWNAVVAKLEAIYATAAERLIKTAV